MAILLWRPRGSVRSGMMADDAVDIFARRTAIACSKLCRGCAIAAYVAFPSIWRWAPRSWR